MTGVPEGMSPEDFEGMSPDDIESARFTPAPEGYDKDEVEVFLKDVAAEVRSLRRRIPTSSERPYFEMGREIADLMRHARDAALHIKKEAQEEAALVLQDAQRAARRTRDDAEQVGKRAEKEASVVREEAYAAAERYRDQAEKAHRLAEAERSIVGQEVRREAKRMRDEAKRQAQDLLARARSEAAERTAESERRLRRLQEAEVALRRRVALLQSKLDELGGKVKERPAPAEADAERTIYLDDPPEGTANGAGPGENPAPRTRPPED